jgi:hypothetical protein
LSSQAIFKYGIRTEFNQVTNPKIKKRAPIIIIERLVVPGDGGVLASAVFEFDMPVVGFLMNNYQEFY